MTAKNSDELYIPDIGYEVQALYCSANNKPLFVPKGGICFHCGHNVFDANGISLLQAANTLVTGCPFCHQSFVD